MTRLLAGFVIAACFAGPALAQPPAKAAKPPSLASRIAALEKENKALRTDIDRLQQQLNRRDVVARRGGMFTPGSAGLIQPTSVSDAQAQSNAIIRQQDVNSQIGNLQLQQNIAQDRLREQQLFQPSPAFPPSP
jgi:hypothetical protein